jgi:hypothetical protein
MLDLFRDADGGGFFTTSKLHEGLVVRSKEFYDGAVPSGNSIAFLDLLRLAELTEAGDFRKQAGEMERVWAGFLADAPGSHPAALRAALARLEGALEIVVIGPRDDSVTRALVEEAQRRFLPAKILLHAGSAEEAQALAKMVPLLEGKTALGGKPTAYVCRGGVCKLPARDLASLRAELGAP